MWNISTILTGLLSFMVHSSFKLFTLQLEDEQTHGSIATTDREKRQLAGYSVQYNLEKNLLFRKHFPELLAPKQLEEARLKSLQPLKAPSSPPPSPSQIRSDPLTDTNTKTATPPTKSTTIPETKTKEKQGGSNLPIFLLVLILLLAAFLNQIL